VIIVSSIGGVRASTVIGAYCISKAADMQLARNLAASSGPTTSASTPSRPGLCAPTSPARCGQSRVPRQALQSAPLRRIGQPDDIAGLAVLLAGKAGAFITGQTLIADGGTTIGG
jgi:NAD(P)-dependent dehydrogenase (short-subunit alcohol dehydrogenase family)